MNVLRKIKDRRVLLGITQQELSDISGVALRTIKQIENETGNPNLNTLLSLLDVLGMELDVVLKNQIR